MKDTQIIELLKAGNYSNVGEKLYTYFPVIKKLVLKNNGSVQDAQDLYQEGLIIFIKKTQDPSFVLTSSLNTYLYSICRFLWNDQLKKKSKKIEVDFEKNVFSLNSEEMENLHSEEKNNILAEKAFNELGEKCKELLHLFYFKKLPLKQIASVLKFSSEKVAKNQKYRCIEKAKENLRVLKSVSHE